MLRHQIVLIFLNILCFCLNANAGDNNLEIDGLKFRKEILEKFKELTKDGLQRKYVLTDFCREKNFHGLRVDQVDSILTHAGQEYHLIERRNSHNDLEVGGGFNVLDNGATSSVFGITFSVIEDKAGKKEIDEVSYCGIISNSF